MEFDVASNFTIMVHIIKYVTYACRLRVIRNKLSSRESRTQNCPVPLLTRVSRDLPTEYFVLLLERPESILIAGSADFFFVVTASDSLCGRDHLRPPEVV